MMYPEAYLSLNASEKLNVLSKIEQTLKGLNSKNFPKLKDFIDVDNNSKVKATHRIIYYMFEDGDGNPKSVMEAVSNIEMEL